MRDGNHDELRQLLEYLEITYGKDYSVSRKSVVEYRKSILRSSQQAAKSPDDVASQKHRATELMSKHKTPGSKISADRSHNKMIISSHQENDSILGQFYQEIKECQNCPLGSTRKNLVFGAGAVDADLMLIGEAPGAEEDNQGIPFIGAAGQLLTKILVAIGLPREEVFIANILKCRPPNNRDPLPDEVAKCIPHLNKQIEIIKPKVILLLGRVAAQTLLDTRDSLKQMRGRVHKYKNIDVMVTYHPAALLRNQNWKRPTWEDFQEVKVLYNELTSGNKNG